MTFLPININQGTAYGNQVLGVPQSPMGTMSPIPPASPVSPTATPTGTNPMANWNWFGDKQSAGILPTAISGLGTLAQGWLGFQQLGLAKDQLALQKRAFETNLANQTQLTNQQLIERQRQRSSFDPNAAQVTEEWKQANLLPTQ